MSRAAFEPEEGLRLLGELAGIMDPPAGEVEVCARGLQLVVTAVRARGGAALLRAGPGLPLEIVSRCGEIPSDLARLSAELAERSSTGLETDPDSTVSVPLPGEDGADGLLVLSRPAAWDTASRFFAPAAARAISVALRSTRLLAESRRRGKLLARCNLELDLLRELAAALQGLVSEDRILQVSIDLIHERLDLQAGWIFLAGPAAGAGRLELAASRGVTADFIDHARDSGPGECLCLDVLASGLPAVARNTVDCPRLPELLQAEGCTCHASIPLKFDRGVRGVLNVTSRPGGVFSTRELAFLETVGGLICLAVDGARTARAESRRTEEAHALVSLAGAVGQSLDLDRILSALGDHVRDLLGADRCLIFLGDGTSPLTLAHLTGIPAEGLIPGRTLDLGAASSSGLTDALRGTRTVSLPGVAGGSPAIPPPASWGPGSALLVPLLSNGRPRGLLVAVRNREAVWSTGEIEMADALAGQAAAAVENARLHREAQEALSRLQQAQYGMMNAERLSALGTLASCLAHEVRNPLNSISLQLVLLGRRVARLETPVQAELSSLIDTARREISRLDGLVEEFLSLSSIDRLCPTMTHPEEVLREVIALMTPVARDGNVSIVEAMEGPLPRVRIDREKIKQVLINLIRNAIEAMPAGGTLTLTGRHRDGALLLTVTDTGTGIAPDLDVFDFFVTTKRGGTGLGLPIARRIAEAHGGTLTFVSEPGRGATFSVRLGSELEARAEGR